MTDPRTPLLFLVALLAACGGATEAGPAPAGGRAGGSNGPSERATPPAPAPSATASMPADVVIVRWAVSQGLWGSELFEIRGDGHAQYDFHPADPSQAAVRGARRATPAELEALHRALVDQDFCHLPASARLGIPDEGRPTLTVAFPDLRCSHTLWDGEWREMARAHACEQAVATLRERTRTEAP